MFRKWLQQRREDKTRRGLGIPLTREINVYDSLDERCAVRNFDGKSLEEAQVMFRESEAYGDDMLFMGPKAFEYYFQALVNHIRSDAATGDEEAVGLLLNCIEFRRKSPEDAACLNDFRDAVQYVRKNWARFRSDLATAGDELFVKYDEEEFARCRELLSKLTQQCAKP